MAGSQSAFVWYELMSSDVAAAKVFYGKVVGWNMQDMPMPGMTYTILEAGKIGIGGMMALPKEACDAGAKPCWTAYIYAADVDAAAKKVEGLGGKVLRAATDIPEVGRFAVVADPQGAVFNLFKPAQPGERVHSKAVGDIGWHELHTKDWPKAFDFYSAMFGWVKGNSVDMGAMGTYQLLMIKDAEAGAMFNSPAATNGPFWLYYFNVEGIDAATDRITKNGGKVMMGPTQVPGGQWIVQATDPQGAWFALVAPNK
jgi:predicted enzyme related to lactoylglutathione lyase